MPKKRPCRRRAPAPSRTKPKNCRCEESSLSFDPPAKKIRQRKSTVAPADECILDAIMAGAEKNRLDAIEARGHRTIFRLRRVSTLRRAWRRVKALFRKLFRVEDSLG